MGKEQHPEEHLKKAQELQQEAMRLHSFYRGKMESAPKCRVNDLNDFAVWYTPGVAAPCQAIAAEPERVYELTNKWNSVAVVSDGSRVLGLGDIGPKAGYPVMEGKALLFKYLGGVDAVPIMLDTKDPDEIIRTVLFLQPTFGGVNLEDLAQPKCFRILETLRREAEIPVWHDDQQGTATVTLAGFSNALKIVDRKIEDIRIVFVGSGAANIACSRLIFARGAHPENCLVVDSRGILGKHRQDLEKRRYEFPEKWDLCLRTNKEQRQGGIPEAADGADVLISLARPGPGTILPDSIKKMNREAIVFACSNPVPEIWPWEAREAGARIVATGRSDFPNQVNNSLGFPAIFRGTLDVRAKTITDEMCFAVAEALAEYAGDNLDEEHLLPTMDDWEVFPHVAAAVGLEAGRQGIAGLSPRRDELIENAKRMIARSRRLTSLMMREGIIERAPD